MSLRGICAVCESRPADHGCQRCGALVCGVHYDEGLGFCSACAALARGGRPDDAGDGSREYRF